MFRSIEFKNVKALRNATLPLGRFTLIVGANGSGKSTALAAIGLLANDERSRLDAWRSVRTAKSEAVKLEFMWKEDGNDYRCWLNSHHSHRGIEPLPDNTVRRPDALHKALTRPSIFSLAPSAIGEPVLLQPQMELAANGAGLAGVLDRIRDQHPERFRSINGQLARWIPEFDQILFETPKQGHRSICLRTREGGHSIKAADLSQGTLIALALLTIAYLPEPPSIVCLEEPDHGLHPRLLRDVRDALYRLAYPEDAKEPRSPVQVIATTHNPYFLDLFKDHPEEIVIAEKIGLEAKFSRLSDRADIGEILADAPLSEVWYSGVLGGVPAGT